MTYTRDLPTACGKPRRLCWWQGRSPWWIAALAVLLVAAVVGVWLLLRSPAPEATGDSGIPLSPAPSAGAGIQAPADCTAIGWPAPAAPGVDGEVPTTWTLIGAVPAPSSPDVGPATLTPVRQCYAHTRTGALYAALDAIAEMNDPAVTPTTVANTLLADGPGRDVVLGWAAKGGQPTYPDDLQWRGYHVITYTDTTAIIDVADGFNGKLTGTVYTVQWTAGTWKLLYPAAGHYDQRDLPILDINYWTELT